jgi:hypothetical protein
MRYICNSSKTIRFLFDKRVMHYNFKAIGSRNQKVIFHIRFIYIYNSYYPFAVYSGTKTKENINQNKFFILSFVSFTIEFNKIVCSSLMHFLFLVYV